MPLSPAVRPPGDPDAADPRFVDLHRGREDADVLLCGIPYDGAVLGRKGCRGGPAGIREALRWLGTDGLAAGPLRRTWHDLGDVEAPEATVLEVHEAVRKALGEPLEAGRPLVVLGGDNSLSFPTLSALADARDAAAGSIGLVVVDAHYDMRAYDGQPTSGTPFRRVLTEMDPAAVRGRNLVEVGIRPYANSAALADFAARHDVTVVSRDEVRQDGPAAVAKRALEVAGDGVDHLWLSIDIDALDQSIAAGCSAPGMDGLLLHEVVPLVAAVAGDPRCRGMEIMETAPRLDPTGNTCRTAAELIGRFVAGLP